LIKIAEETNVSLNWLLTGTGEMYAGTPGLDLGRILEIKIGEMIDRRLSGEDSVQVMDLGNIDTAPAFDVPDAVRRYDDPQKIMSRWFRHEGRRAPQDYGVVFFAGWESYTEDEKVEAIRDAKKVLDRTLKRKKK
jgi:hypothetical protein